jgi:hypothetical protein
MQYTIKTPTIQPVKLSHSDSLFFIGSCFADEVGNRFRNDLFDVCINPHGILFNPVSIANVMHGYLNQQAQPSMVYANQIHAALSYHGAFASHIQSNLEAKIATAQLLGEAGVAQAHTVFITWGSAWVYEWKETGAIVANCHKLPAALFQKRLLTVAEIVQQWQSVIAELQARQKQVVITISPVRYIKDGVHENNLSKATLFLALKELQNQGHLINYFPAYEMVVDELRDYRFYKEDMVHPTSQAVDYVYESILFNSQSDVTASMLSAIRSVMMMKKHQIPSINEQEYHRHQTLLASKIQALLVKYPHLHGRILLEVD